MNSSASLFERIEELKHLLSERDLGRLTRRMLDLIAEGRFSQETRRKAISLRARYNAILAEQTGELTGAVPDEWLIIASNIIEEIESSIPDSPEIQEVKQNKAEPFFTGSQITKRFSTPSYQFELQPVNLNLNGGEITGIVGENGNGKTTLLRMVAGELKADGGSFIYPGIAYQKLDWYRIKQHIAFIPQQLPVWQGFLKENLHFTAAIHGIKGKENEEIVEFFIHRLGLTQYEEALWSEISSGYKLRFELARALVRNPRILIIDEPLANLDINTQEMFLQDLRNLADRIHQPTAILLSSQHLHEVESIADNILFLRQGETLYNGKMKEFGEDRSENVFELTTTLSKIEILSRLQDPSIRVDDLGQTLVFRTPLDIDANALLKQLIQSEIPVGYFRDISGSTLKLFRES